jgi:alpha-D-xyloside xylohydrolase
MPEITSESYPQKIDSRSMLTERVLTGPGAFKWGENIVFWRVSRLLSLAPSENTLRLLCETKPFLNRTCWTHETSMHQFAEDKENQPSTLNVEIAFWSKHVFRVQFSRDPIPTTPPFPPPEARMLIGEPEASFELAVAEIEGGWVARTAAVVLHVDQTPFRLWATDVHDRVFWQQRLSDLFTADIFDMAIAEHRGEVACFESFALGGHEEIFGLGERFDHVPRTGKNVDFWNKDAIGTSSQRTYINVPFLLSTQGYGLFLNTSCHTEWEIGTLNAFSLGFAVEDCAMDYFVIHGPQPADILLRYCELTGFSPTPPVWSFGLWMSRNSYLSWDVVHEVADGLRQRGIPTDVLHLDTAWFKEDWNCDLRFSMERFADPERHLAQLREQGFRVSLWQYNFVPPRENNCNYREGRAKGYFAKDSAGEVFKHPAERKGSWMDDAIIDFSNPGAVAWYAAQIEALMRLGASSIKTDFGEGIPEEAVYQNINGRRFHNLYSLVYNSVIAKAIKRVTGEDIVWARSGTAGSQRYPLHWGGDSQCSFAGLAGTLRAALSIGLSGFPFFSHDIGGFIGRPSSELFIRWAQFGLFSSHARCHGCGNENSREPWTFGEQANEIFKSYAILRYRLLPYLYDQARRCSRTAKPMVRALVIDYPEDRNVWPLQDQYLLGDAILIAPVLRSLAESPVRDIYLPAGRWIDFWTKQSIDSRGEWITRAVDLATMPMYVKAGTVLPYGEERLTTHNSIGPIVELEVYAGAVGRLDYEDAEKCFTASWDGSKLDLNGLQPKPRVTVYPA